MPHTPILIQGPAADPVSLALAKQHLNVSSTFTDDDTYIGSLITAARSYAERRMSRPIFNQTWQISMDTFPWPFSGRTVNPADRHLLFGSFWPEIAIYLPSPSVPSVNWIKYFDLTDTLQTLAATAYQLDSTSMPARIFPVGSGGLYWPYVRTWIPGSVTVEYVSGSYGDGVIVNNCPEDLVIAIMQIVADWYQSREATSTVLRRELPHGVTAILAQYEFNSFRTFG